MTPLARLGGITIDCPEPRALARFYQEITGWTVGYDSSDYVFLEAPGGTTPAGGPGIGFQRVPNHQAPTWPDGSVPSQAHLDFFVADLAEADRRLEQLGATKAPSQPGDPRWWVYADPAGHPFCIAVPGAFDD